MAKDLLPAGCRKRACALITEYEARGLSKPTILHEAFVRMRAEYPKDEHPNMTDQRILVIIQFYQDHRGDC
jgi:hypothetical protein